MNLHDAKRGGRRQRSSSNALKTVTMPNAHSASGNGLLLGGAYQSIPMHRQREVRRASLPSSPSLGPQPFQEPRQDPPLARGGDGFVLRQALRDNLVWAHVPEKIRDPLDRHPSSQGATDE